MPALGKSGKLNVYGGSRLNLVLDGRPKLPVAQTLSLVWNKAFLVGAFQKQGYLAVLQAFRGVQEVAAATIVAEVGSFLRFGKASQLMAYLGAVPSEYSSGQEIRRGKITKTGNSHLRRIVTECA